jgi:hypothetical protein
MALIRLNSIRPRGNSSYCQQHLIQAMMILFWSMDDAPGNRQVSMLLVQVLQKLGLTSLALVAYSTLEIKEIMHDTLSHMLYTRISSIHPFPAVTAHTKQSSKVVNDPWLGLHNVLNIYTPSILKILKFQGHAVGDFEYDQIGELQRLRNRLGSSLTRQLWILETRRIAFSRGSPDEAPFPKPMGEKYPYIMISRNSNNRQEGEWLDVVDNRDFKAMVDCESLFGARLLDSVLVGPKPGVRSSIRDKTSVNNGLDDLACPILINRPDQ